MMWQHVRVAVGVWLAAIVTVGAQAAGTVTRVIDGDTIVVQGVGTVRLIGVDTPETSDPRVPVRVFGAEATAFTTRLAQRRPVRLEFEGRRKDRYDRTLAYVYLPGGALLNAEIIRQGYGHAYTEFPFARMEEFRSLEKEAAAAGRGLWGQDPPVETALAAFRAEGVQAGTETVYVTRTGEKYHNAGCRHLARSQISMPLKDAAGRYGPCSTCKPPILTTIPSASPAKLPAAGSAPLATGPSSEASTPVMVSRTGTKYHRATCRTLRNGSIPSTLGEAATTYGPCGVCRPPVMSAVAAPAIAPRTTPPTSASSGSAAASNRCQATTKRGTQCSRTAQAGRNYCWQH